MEKVKNISFEKYLGTDIDEIVIHFSKNANRKASLNEIDLPEEINSIITYEAYDDNNEYS